MLVNGIAYMTRRSPCRLACSSAKESDDNVFPPPVGTVSEKRPGGCEPALRQACSTSALRRLTAVGSASADFRAKCASSLGNSELRGGQSPLPVERGGCEKASASRKTPPNSPQPNIPTPIPP